MQRDDQHKMVQGTSQNPTYKAFAGTGTLQGDAVEAAKKGQLDYVASYGDVSVAEVKGRRTTQEDRVVVESMPGEVDLRQGKVLSDTLQALHDNLQPDIKGGSCGLVCAVQGTQICTANLGDSTAYVVIVDDKNNVIECRRVNNLHKPDSDPAVKVAHEKLGGFTNGMNQNGAGILYDYLTIVEGEGVDEKPRGIAVSRAIGDTKFDPAGMTHTPDIYNERLKLQAGNKAFLIVACDGMTEAVERQHKNRKEKGQPSLPADADADYVKGKVQTILRSTPNITPDELSKRLVEGALKDDSTDNISVISVAIDPASKNTRIVAVFDGHGGSAVSQHCQNKFMPYLREQLTSSLQQSHQQAQQPQKKLSAEPSWLIRDADERQQSLEANSDVPEWIAKLQSDQQQPSQEHEVRSFFNAFNQARLNNSVMLAKDQKQKLFNLLTTPEGKAKISNHELRGFVKTLNLQGDTRFNEFVAAYISNPGQDFTHWHAPSKQATSVSTNTATSAAATSPASKLSSHSLFSPATATSPNNTIDRENFKIYYYAFIEHNKHNKEMNNLAFNILHNFVLNIIEEDTSITYNKLKTLANESNNKTVIKFVNDYINFSSQQSDKPVARPRG